MTQDLNLNATECIVRARDIGGTIIRNVCSGAEHYVPWGSADWAGAVVLVLIGFAVSVIVTGITIAVVRG